MASIEEWRARVSGAPAAAPQQEAGVDVWRRRLSGEPEPAPVEPTLTTEQEYQKAFKEGRAYPRTKFQPPASIFEMGMEKLPLGYRPSDVTPYVPPEEGPEWRKATVGGIAEQLKKFAKGYPPETMKQSVLGAAAGLGAFIGGLGARVAEFAKQVAGSGEMDWGKMAEEDWKVAEELSYEVTDPGAQVVLGVLTSIPATAKMAGHAPADWLEENHPDKLQWLQAGLRAGGDVAELVAFGWLFAKLKGRIRPEEPIPAGPYREFYGEVPGVKPPPAKPWWKQPQSAGSVLESRAKGMRSREATAKAEAVEPLVKKYPKAKAKKTWKTKASAKVAAKKIKEPVTPVKVEEGKWTLEKAIEEGKTAGVLLPMFREPALKPGEKVRIKPFEVLGEEVLGISDKVLDEIEKVTGVGPSKKSWEGGLEKLKTHIGRKYGSETLREFNRAYNELTARGEGSFKSAAFAAERTLARVEKLPIDKELPPERTVEVKPEESPFYETMKETEAKRPIYDDPATAKRVDSDLETFTIKLTHHMNRWIHGDDKVDVEATRSGLSEMAARSDEMWQKFADRADHKAWAATVEDAAIWARRAKRAGVEEIPAIEPKEVPRKLELAGEGFLTKEEIGVGLPPTKGPSGFDRLAENLGRKYDATYVGQLEGVTKKGEKPIALWSMKMPVGEDIVFKTRGLNITELRVKSDLVKKEQIRRARGKPSPTEVAGVDWFGDKLYAGFPADKAAELLKDTTRRFKGRIIKSVSQSQSRILKDITALFTNSKIDADLTHSLGKMWKRTGIEPKYKFDIRPQTKDTTQANVSERIPLEDSSINSAMYDPPFLVGRGKSLGMMAERFGRYSSVEELLKDYQGAIREAFRVLKPGGVLVTKTQDIISPYVPTGAGSTILPMSSEVYNIATKAGFRPTDRFIFHRTRALGLPPRVRKQAHARRAHSDFWVFTKPKKVAFKPLGALYAGLPIPEMAKQTKALLDKLEAARLRPFGEMAREARDKFIKQWVDTHGNVKRELRKTYKELGDIAAEALALQRGAPGRARSTIVLAKRQIYGGLSGKLKRVVDRVAFARRVIQIDRYRDDITFPDNKGGEYYKSYLENIERLEGLKPGEGKLVVDRADVLFDISREQLKRSFDAGLISKTELDSLLKFDYLKFELVDRIDPRVRLGGKRIDVRESGVEPLAKGKAGEMLRTDSELLLEELITRTEGRIAANITNRSVLEVARAYPDGPLVRLRQEGVKIPRGWTKVNVFEKGERLDLYMPDNFAKEWKLGFHEVSQNLANFIRLASGSAFLRPMATGIFAPEFAFVNFVRDIPHAFLVSNIKIGDKWESTYSPHIPIAAGQMIKDAIEVFPDVIARKGIIEEYGAHGGLMPFMIQQGKMFRKSPRAEGKLSQIGNVMGWLTETSELQTRAMLTNRAMKKRAAAGKKHDFSRATFVARDYLDHGQGGSYSKFLDNGLPYFNTAIQANRGIARAAWQDPVVFGYKVAQLSALSAGLYLANRYTNKKCLDSVPQHVKEDNFVLTTPFEFKNEYGEDIRTYFTVPKDPGQKAFSAAAEYITAKSLGDKVDVELVTSSLKKLFSPIEALPIFPSLSAGIALLYNKDTWTGDAIWRGPEIEAAEGGQAEKYYTDTHPFFVTTGKLAHLPPAQLENAMQSVFTRGNIYTHAVGWGYKEMFGKLPGDVGEKTWAQALAKTPINKRFFKVTTPYTKWAKDVERITSEESLKRLVETRNLDIVAAGHLIHGTHTKADVRKEIKSHKEKHTRDRLIKRYKFQNRVKDLNERSLWLRLERMVPEGRARIFHQRWSAASESERADIKKEMAKVKGLFTDRFKAEYRKVRAAQ